MKTTRTQQLINVNLNLTRVLKEVARLEYASTAQAQTNVPAIFNPAGYCWYHEYKVRMGHTIRTCTTRREGHTVDATQADIKGGKEYNKT